MKFDKKTLKKSHNTRIFWTFDRFASVKLPEYAKGGTEADALAKSEVLEFLFEHMPENYRLMFKNVL